VFSANATEASATVNIISDNLLENDETIQLSIILSSLPERVILGKISKTTINIKDNNRKSLIL